MSTWAKKSSEFLGFLTGFDERDAFSKHQRFPVVNPNEGDTVGQRKPPLVTQNDILALVYKVIGILRKWLQEGSDERPPTARGLLDDPKADELFFRATRPMVDFEFDVSRPTSSSKPFVVLERAVKDLVTEAWIERLRTEFVNELSRSLKMFRTHLEKEKDRAEYDDWQDKLDGGVVLYDIFRPNLWEAYQKFWGKWNADMERIRALAKHLQRLDDTLNQDEGDL